MSSLAHLVFWFLFAATASTDDPHRSDGVTITPALASDSMPAHSGPWLEEFLVQNTSGSSGNFTLTCSGVRISACTVTPSSISLAAGGQLEVTASFTTGDVSSFGSVKVTAAGSGSGIGSMALKILASMVRMTGPGPDASATQQVHRTRPVLRADFVLPAGQATDTSGITLWWRGVVASSGTLRRNAAMLEWEVPSDLALAPGDTGTFKVRHCLISGICTNESRVVQLPADQKPVVDFVGMPFEATGGGFSTGFGPGLAVSGAELTTGIATPAYVSMGAARSAALVYSTRTAFPQALVTVDIRLPWPTSGTYDLATILFDGASRVDSLKVSSATCVTASEALKACRVVLQAAYLDTIPGRVARRWYKVEVTVTSGGTPKTTTDSVEVVLVDRRTSPFGSGWWPAAGSQLYGAGSDRVLVGPSGNATIYRGSGDSLYLPPPGSTTNLVKVSGGWELRTRGTTAKVVFDANGRVTKGIDASGNRDSIAYDGSGRIAALIDPTDRRVAFYYGAGTGKLDSLVTLPGTGESRRTRVSIDTATNQLRYDSLASPTVRPIVNGFAYVLISGGAQGTALLADRWGRFGADSVHIVYDSAAHPVESRLLAATINGTVPVLAYQAADLQGWKSFRSLDSSYVQVTDPLGHWTRSRLTRYAQTVHTWDAIGALGRAGFDGFGRMIWAEGKNADSSRVWTQYDSVGHAYRSFLVRSAGDTLWLSRLTFDPSDRVVKRLDPLGHADSMGYDAAGRPNYTRDIAGGVTRWWYRSDGLVDSMRGPGSTLAQRITYTSGWLNPERAYVAAGDSLANETLYDAQGVANGSKGKIRVRLNGNQVTWRWRQSTVWRDAAGRPDSSAIYQTAECSSPCTTPGAFSRIRTHYVTYDSVGQVRQERDSGTAVSSVVYVRDRLGRVLESQRNGAQGDSLVYDLAGRVVASITRRGDQIQAFYDSRNRDTSTVIPGYGTVTRTYGGPQDQLTKITVASYVDPIGGVEPGRRWAYDQRGRLLSDTLWTGTGQPRPTTYAYDRYDRDTLAVDARGATGTRVYYDTTLGRLAGVRTPFGDSLAFSWDTAGRPVQARVVPTTGRILTNAWTFTGPGSLETSGATLPSGGGLAGYDAGTWADYGDYSDGNQDLTLLPVWTRQDGDGTTLHTERDSLRYDGLERLTRWKGMTDGALVASDSFSYDASGNLKMNSDSSLFEAGTNRLTFRISNGHRYRYAYDVAGNLTTMVDSLDEAPAKYQCRTMYEYDALDRLTLVRMKPKIGDTVVVARYAYDVLGNRIARRVYAQVSSCSTATPTFVRYAVQGGQVLFETDSVGATKLREYAWGLGTDDLVAARVGGNADSTFYAVKDQLGSIRAWVTRAGTWRWGGRYRPYGVQAESRGTSPDVPYSWTGREFDPETGLYFLRARYYAPAVGRFTQEDPLGSAGGANLYAYVNGQPLEATDPSGLTTEYVESYTWCSPTTGNCVGWDGTYGASGGAGMFEASSYGAQLMQEFLDRYEADVAYDAYVMAYRAAAAAAAAGDDATLKAVYGSGAKMLKKGEFRSLTQANAWLASRGWGLQAEAGAELLVGGWVLMNNTWLDANHRDALAYALENTRVTIFRKNVIGNVGACYGTAGVAHLWSHEISHHRGIDHGPQMERDLFAQSRLTHGQVAAAGQGRC